MWLHTWGVPKSRGPFLVGPQNTEHKTLGSTFGTPPFTENTRCPQSLIGKGVLRGYSWC